MKKYISIATFALFIIPITFGTTISSASEEIPLDEDQVYTLFENKTFDYDNHFKGKKFKAFNSEDGQHIVKGGGKTRTTTWYAKDGGYHCIVKKKGDVCRKVYSLGDGTYKMYIKGKHSHTLSNFVKGNHL